MELKDLMPTFELCKRKVQAEADLRNINEGGRNLNIGSLRDSNMSSNRSLTHLVESGNRLIEFSRISKGIRDASRKNSPINLSVKDEQKTFSPKHPSDCASE